MTPPDLQALAAECEARAAAGETPRCEWNSPENDRGFFRVCHGDEYRYVDEHDRTTNVSKIILPSMIVMSANVGFSANVAGIPFFELSFSSALAGQLFCEAVTWRAYAPLAPLPARAAHVEALAFAAKVLAAMQEFGRTAGDADTWMCELGDMAMKSGFLCEPPEWNLTDLGRQLLADAATLARPKEPPMPEPTDPLLFGGQIQGGPPRQPSPCADCGADELAFGFGTHSWKCGSSTLNGMKHVSRECLDRQLTALRAAVARLEGELAEAKHDTERVRAEWMNEKIERGRIKDKHDWLFQQNCELSHRVEVEDADTIQRLESALAAKGTDAILRDGVESFAFQCERLLARLCRVPDGSRLIDEWEELAESALSQSVTKAAALRAIHLAYSMGIWDEGHNLRTVHEEIDAMLARALAESDHAPARGDQTTKGSEQ